VSAVKIEKYVLAAILIAVIAHFAFVIAVPRVLMNAAYERLSAAGGVNAWRVGERVSADSRQIVRPSPDFAYSSCAYDLSEGPLRLQVAPWDAYWSLSLYGANTDNYFVIDDREAHHGVEIVLIRRGRRAPDSAVRVVESPSARGIALIRRLAPTRSAYDEAAEIARGDICAALS
jgi:uncharacterized membrane protein